MQLKFDKSIKFPKNFIYRKKTFTHCKTYKFYLFLPSSLLVMYCCKQEQSVLYLFLDILKSWSC